MSLAWRAPCPGHSPKLQTHTPTACQPPTPGCVKGQAHQSQPVPDEVHDLVCPQPAHTAGPLPAETVVCALSPVSSAGPGM